MDVDSANANVVHEPGEASMDQIMGMQPVELELVYAREKMISFANSGRGWINATPDTYIPTDFFNINIKKKYFVSTPSVLLMGASAPNMDDIITSTPSTPTAVGHWYQMQFIKDTLDDMFKFLVGLVEAGAETPYEEAAQRIADWLYEDVLEHDAASFATHSWTIFSKWILDATFEGSHKIGVLTSEGV